MLLIEGEVGKCGQDENNRKAKTMYTQSVTKKKQLKSLGSFKKFKIKEKGN